ncbi:MAG: hypothetical protein HYR85_13380 [Planctomycetes bacterium]|nr:hypothetical protein [Planctomycetota bacterium]MBI3845893.1 hypothetical protein [Planctomycetota bacterium]
MARKRTQKTLARQLALDYFAKPFWFRSWRRRLTWGLFAVALVWLGFLAARGDQRVYSAGPTALSHRTIESDCAKCHATFDSTPDAKCLACHPDQTAPHDKGQTTTPECASCHVEHRGRGDLATVATFADRACTHCHADLRTHDGPPKKVVAHIASFDSDHPEFRALSPDVSDRTKIRLNHATHLHLSKDDPKLKPLADKLPMTCQACHHPDEAGRHFQPITFEQSCQDGCHSLTFDERTPDLTAPHEPLDVVRGFLQRHYSSIAKDSRSIKEKDAATWVSKEVEKAEVFLWEARCKQCHDLTAAERPDAPKSVVPTNANGQRKRWLAEPDLDPRTRQPLGWLTRASFDHSAHRAVRCDACHAKAVDSKKTEDVLLPGIASCRSCHKADEGARTQCSECHLYHDRSAYQKRGGTLGLGFEEFKDRAGDLRR